MKKLILFYVMSYIVPEDSVLESVNALAEDKHSHVKLLCCVM